MIKDCSNDQKQIAQNRQHLRTPRLPRKGPPVAILVGGLMHSTFVVSASNRLIPPSPTNAQPRALEGLAEGWNRASLPAAGPVGWAERPVPLGGRDHADEPLVAER